MSISMTLSDLQWPSAAAHLARANISKSATFVAYRTRLSYYLYSHKHSQPVGLTVFQNLKIPKWYGSTANWLHVCTQLMLGQVTTK